MLASSKHHLALVGVSGAGKSTVGRALAERLGVPFVDIDAEIVARENRSISDIFSAEGEPYFRTLESEVLREMLMRSEPTIISCGGGVILDETNRVLLSQYASVAHLIASLSEAYRRIAESDESRPLADNVDKATFEALYAERKIAADAIADVTIDTTNKTIDGICEELDGIFHT